MANTIESLKKRLNVRLNNIVDKTLDKKIESTLTKLNDVADAWKNNSIGLLSVKATSKRNTSKYPRYVTRDLLSSLDYEIKAPKLTKRKNGNTVKISIQRYFKSFRRKPSRHSGAFNYVNHLNESGKSFGGFKERIYAKLDKRIETLLKRI